MPLAVPEAVMVTLPAVLPIAKPLLLPLSILAMAGSLLLQFNAALLVISSEPPSDKIAVATNVCSNPMGTDAVAGVTCSAVTTALVTVSAAVALKLVPWVAPEAVMVTVPTALAVAKPLLAPLSMLARAGSLLLQLSAALLVISNELPSDKKAVATNACSNP